MIYIKYMIENKYIDKTSNGVITNKGFETILTAEGDRNWYLDGKLHREDGPAVESGLSKNLWYLDGVRLYEPQIRLLKNIINCSFKDLVLKVGLPHPFKDVVARRLIIKNYNPVSSREYPLTSFVEKMLVRDLY